MRSIALAALLLCLAAIPAPAAEQSGLFTVPGLRYSLPANNLFNTMPLPVPDGISGVQVYYRDFLNFEGKLNANTSTGDTEGGWLYTITEAGAGESGVTIDTSQYGVIAFLNDAGANDTITAEGPGTPWKVVVGKQLWFLAKLKLDTVNKTLFQIGLVAGITSNDLFNATAPTDGIWFEKKTAANTDIDFHVRKSGTSTSTTSVCGSAMTDDTFRVVGFQVTTAGGVSAWCGTSFATMTQVASVAAGGANIPTAALKIAIGVKNGEAVAHKLSLDDLYVAQER